MGAPTEYITVTGTPKWAPRATPYIGRREALKTKEALSLLGGNDTRRGPIGHPR